MPTSLFQVSAGSLLPKEQLLFWVNKDMESEMCKFLVWLDELYIVALILIPLNYSYFALQCLGIKEKLLNTHLSLDTFQGQVEISEIVLFAFLFLFNVAPSCCGWLRVGKVSFSFYFPKKTL